MLLGSGELLYTCMEDCWVLVLKGKRESSENTVRCGLVGAGRPKHSGRGVRWNGSEAWDLEEWEDTRVASVLR